MVVQDICLFFMMRVTCDKSCFWFKVFDNEDDIFHIFQECSKIKSQQNIIFKKQKHKYYEIETIYGFVEK